MKYTAKAAVCTEICVKRSVECEYRVEFLMLNLLVPKETARL
jgi:hypothetical protein